MVERVDMSSMMGGIKGKKEGVLFALTGAAEAPSSSSIANCEESCTCRSVSSAAWRDEKPREQRYFVDSSPVVLPATNWQRSHRAHHGRSEVIHDSSMPVD